MLSLIRSDFTWRFAGGFVFGAIALFALQPPLAG